MSKNLRYFRFRILLVLVMFVLAMTASGIFIFRTLNRIVEKYGTDLTTENARFAADYYYQDMIKEMETLEHISNILDDPSPDVQAADIEETRNIIYSVFGEESGLMIGLLDSRGDAILGEKLSLAEYPGILRSLRGVSAISYTESGGVLFTYPVLHGDNVHYVLYALCSSEYIISHHDISIFSEKGELGDLSILTVDGETVVPYVTNDEKKLEFLHSDPVQNEIYELAFNHNYDSVSVSLKDTAKGDMYFFSSEIPHTDFILVGVRPKENVIGTYLKMLPFFYIFYFLFVALVLILAIYLYISSVKVRESDELKEAKQEAEEASKAKSLFLSNMTHEIRTPINAVLGIDEMILREYSDPTLIQYASSIKSSATSLLNLVNGILDFSRMDAGKISLANDPYDVSLMVSDLIVMVKPRLDEKNIEFKYFVNRDMPSILLGDVVRMKQVILNLLTNAAKYTNEGFVNLVIDYDLQKEKNGIIMHVAVKDTGIGIREEDLKKIFNAFERFDLEKNKTIEGTGLGLSITKQILTFMDSELKIKSVYGAGSEFSFDVFQEIYDSRPIGNFSINTHEIDEQNESSYVPEFKAPDAHILIVDDTEINLVVVQGLLKATQVRIDTALNGRQALDLTSRNEYDLMLIDQRMPEMDGMDLIKLIRADSSNVNHDKPAIMFTANVVDGIREECLEAGFNDFLEKPVYGNKLEKAILKHLPSELVLSGNIADNRNNRTENTETDSEDPVSDKLTELEKNDLINIASGTAYAGNMDMFLTTLRFFRDSIDAKADEIEEFYDSGNYDAYTAKVHALKSSARIIGADALSEQAKRLEQAASKGDLDYVSKNNLELLINYRQYKDYLSDI